MATYADIIQQWSILCEMSIAPAYSLTDVPDFANTLPNAITYAEGRIYRACTFLAQRVQNAAFSTVAGSREVDFSAASPLILVPEGVALITPTATLPAAGIRQAFDETSLDVIDLMWPQESITLSPAAVQSGRMWALKDDHTLVLAPTPDAIYKAEITALVQPLALSATVTQTYLSKVYSDLLINAGMVYLSGFLRDYGAQSEDPRTGASWESQYKALESGVMSEEQRRRGQGTGWSPNAPTALANPQRT